MNKKQKKQRIMLISAVALVIVLALFAYTTIGGRLFSVLPSCSSIIPFLQPGQPTHEGISDAVNGGAGLFIADCGQMIGNIQNFTLGYAVAGSPSGGNNVADLAQIYIALTPSKVNQANIQNKASLSFLQNRILYFTQQNNAYTDVNILSDTGLIAIINKTINYNTALSSSFSGQGNNTTTSTIIATTTIINQNPTNTNPPQNTIPQTSIIQQIISFLDWLFGIK